MLLVTKIIPYNACGNRNPILTLVLKAFGTYNWTLVPNI